MASTLWSNLKARLAKPLIGLGTVGVSATLAACYGPPPHYADGKAPDQNTEEYCELILQQGCKDENGQLPPACDSYCMTLRIKKCTDNEVTVPDCCPPIAEDRIEKLCRDNHSGN